MSLALLTGLLPNIGAAQTDISGSGPVAFTRCSDYGRVAPLLARNTPEAMKAELLPEDAPLTDDCRLLQVHLAMRLGDWELANVQVGRHLEKYPQDAGAWLDLAIARHRQGDKEGAQELFILIETRFAPPPAIRQLIAQLREESRPQSSQRFATHFQSFSFMLAHDSNANMGFSSNGMNITVGDDTQYLLFAQDFLPRSDWAAQMQYLAAGNLNPWNGAAYRAIDALPPLEWFFLARKKNFENETRFNSRQMQLSLAQPLQYGNKGLTLRARLQSDKLNNNGSISSLRLGMAYQYPLRTCRLTLGVDQETRRHAGSDLLDGNISWLGGDAGCASPAYPDTRLQTWFRLGNDRARSTRRAGGDTIYQEIGVSLRQQLAPRWQADLTWQISRAKDSDRYSVLLKNGATRHIQRRFAGLALEYRIRPAFSLLFQIADYRQRSNLPLFTAKNRSVSLGFAYDW
jgi:hypothetical protein